MFDIGQLGTQGFRFRLKNFGNPKKIRLKNPKLCFCHLSISMGAPKRVCHTDADGEPQYNGKCGSHGHASAPTTSIRSAMASVDLSDMQVQEQLQ